MTEIGRSLIFFGVVLLVLGGVFLLAEGRLPWLGRLPGDIEIRRGSFRFYFPIATCLVVSVVLSLVLSLFRR
jgi:hypothetical protein